MEMTKMKVKHKIRFLMITVCANCLTGCMHMTGHVIWTTCTPPTRYSELCIVRDANIRHRHHLASMELGHLLTHSGLTHLAIFLTFSPGFFYLLVFSILIFSVIYYGAFCFYVANKFFCIPVVCPKLGLYLALLQSLCLFYNISMCMPIL